jgi:hypothetical protein
VHNIQPDVPPENMVTMWETALERGAQQKPLGCGCLEWANPAHGIDCRMLAGRTMTIEHPGHLFRRMVFGNP